ncbi:hypothetical protein DPEC_G00294920 [Dallia pectoralis]|uniref:Uncharacterized protein n=1 Tax=Dallia pectoralis TaxID=75939 RepID=A0ACC2FIL4_DALPE|nr:hypothetical protein DPEC_G00294920 [Dallia pectoralis]
MVSSDFGEVVDIDKVSEDEVSEEEEEDDDEISPLDLSTALSGWAVEYGVSLVAFPALLCILRVHHPFLPKDGRTLLKTATKYTLERRPSRSVRCLRRPGQVMTSGFFTKQIALVRQG